MFKCNVRLFDLFSIHYSVGFSAIPDDAMDVDRVVDEDKDSDPDKVRGKTTTVLSDR